MTNAAPLARGQVFYAERFNTAIEVLQVAKDRSWADVIVRSDVGTSWRKRQPLRDGRFPFQVRRTA